MLQYGSNRGVITAAVIAFGLMTTSLAATSAAAPPAQQRAAGTQARTVTTPDGDWPRRYTTGSGARLVVYQPQVVSWERQKHAVMYAAVSYAAAGTSQPALGTIKLECDTSVALGPRLVSLT